MALCGLLRASRGPGRPHNHVSGPREPVLGLSGALPGVYPGVWGDVRPAHSGDGFPGRVPRAASQGRVSRAACLVVGEPALSKNPLCIGRETTHPEENKDLAILAIRYDFSLPLPYIKGFFGG